MKRKTKSLVWGTILALGIVTLPLNTYGEEFTSSAEAGFTSEDMTTSEETPVTEENVPAGTDEGNEQTEETVENEKTEEPASGEEVNLEEENSEDQGFFGTEENVDNPVAFSSEESAENQVFFGDAERLDDEIAAVGASGTGFDGAKTIYTNTMYSTNFTDSIRERWLEFTVTGDGYISLDFSHEYLESDRTYWWATIYTDGSHNQLASYGFAGNNVSYSLQKFGISAGTYYLKINADYFSDVKFKFKLNYEVADNWESEVNDTYQHADLISCNKQYNGSFQRDGDIDWYKFEILQNGSVSIDFEHDYIENDKVFWYFELYNEDFNFLNCGSIQGTYTRYSGSTCGIPAGTYFLKIQKGDQYKYSDFVYRLKINYTSSSVWEKEVNDSYWLANPINLNTLYYGALLRWNEADVDWYKFISPAEGKYEFYFGHEYVESDRDLWIAEIYEGSSFNKINTFFYAGNKQNSSNDISLSGGKTYYIKILNPQYHWTDANYSLKVVSHVTVKEGWVKSESNWQYRLSTGEFVTDSWKKIGNNWYHFDEEGYMQTGWLKLGNTWYYLKSNGVMAKDEWVENSKYYIDASGKYVPGKKKNTAGWKKNSKGYWYQNSDGSYPKNQWKSISGSWYHFDSKGYMQTGWLKLGNTWYYLKTNGMMAKNEWVENGKYYIDANGKYVPGKTKYAAGWKKNSKGYWYQNSDGSYPKNQWKNISGSWYHFDAKGYMQTGWLSDGGNLYYLKSNGMMAKNEWVVNGRYYIDINGHLA